jgi:hypothetical protein
LGGDLTVSNSPESKKPNESSAAAAVSVLQAELDLTSQALDSIDQKAALIPPLVGAVAALVIAPDMSFTYLQAAILFVAFVYGAVAYAFAIRVLWASNLNVGPGTKEVANITYLEPADFSQSVAAALAESVEANKERSEKKGRMLNTAFVIAAFAILLLIAARVAGGPAVADNQNHTPSSSTPTAPAQQTPAQPTPGAAQVPVVQVEVAVRLPQEVVMKGGGWWDQKAKDGEHR